MLISTRSGRSSSRTGSHRILPQTNRHECYTNHHVKDLHKGDFCTTSSTPLAERQPLLRLPSRFGATGRARLGRTLLWKKP